MNSIKSKLYDKLISILRYIPMMISISYTLKNYCYINGEYLDILSYISGMSIVPFIYIYISSHVFKFCFYHRVFMYHIFIDNISIILNYEFELNIDCNYLASMNLWAGMITIIIFCKFLIKKFIEVTKKVLKENETIKSK